MKWFKKLLHKSAVNQTASADAVTAAATGDKRRLKTAQTTAGILRKANSKSGGALIKGSTASVCCSGSKSSISNSCSNGNLTTIDAGVSPRKKRRTYQESVAVVQQATLMAALENENDCQTTTMTATTMATIVTFTTFVFADPDEFFDDPADVAAHRAERRMLAEWQLIDESHCAPNEMDDDDEDDELNTLYQTTSFNNSSTGGGNKDDNDDDESENHVLNVDDAKKPNDKAAENTDKGSEYDDNDPERHFVHVQRTPSVISLGSYSEDKFGIYAQPYRQMMPKYKDAVYRFASGIQCGVPLPDADQTQSAFEEIIVETFRMDSGGAPELNTIDDITTPGTLCKRHLTSGAIAQRFRLDDAGSICLQMDHIREERGYGFLMRRSKRIYRNVKVGRICDERLRVSGTTTTTTTDYYYYSATDNGGNNRIAQLLRHMWRRMFQGKSRRGRSSASNIKGLHQQDSNDLGKHTNARDPSSSSSDNSARSRFATVIRKCMQLRRVPLLLSLHARA